MAVGDEVHVPSWEAGYLFGWWAGYEEGHADKNEAWRELASQRVFTAGAWQSRPSAAEKRAERELTLQEGHDAGLHMGRVAYGCPLCR